MCTSGLTTAPPKARDHLAMLKRQIGLAERIVSDILDFTRVKPPERKEIDVAEFIEDQLQRVSAPPSIQVTDSLGRP